MDNFLKNQDDDTTATLEVYTTELCTADGGLWLDQGNSGIYSVDIVT